MTTCYTCPSTLADGIYGPCARCDTCIENTREERCVICDTPCSKEHCNDCIAGRCEVSGRLCVYSHCFCEGCQWDHYTTCERERPRSHIDHVYGCLPADRLTEYCLCSTCEKVYYSAYEDWRTRKAWAEWEDDEQMMKAAPQTLQTVKQ